MKGIKAKCTMYLPVHVLQQIAYFNFFLQACSFNVRKNFAGNYYQSGYFPQVDTTGRLCLSAQFNPKRITENILVSYIDEIQ